MKNSIFNENDYQNLSTRLNQLTASSKNVHGIMTANQMVCHLTDPFLDLLKMRETKPAVPFFLRPLLKGFLLGEKPWKFGLKTIRLYKQGGDGKGTKPTSFEADKKKIDWISRKISQTSGLLWIWSAWRHRKIKSRWKRIFNVEAYGPSPQHFWFVKFNKSFLEFNVWFR